MQVTLILVSALAVGVAGIALVAAWQWSRRARLLADQSAQAEAARIQAEAALSEVDAFDDLREEMRRTAEDQRRVLESQRDAMVQAALDQVLTAQRAVGEEQQQRAESVLTNKQALIDAQMRAMHEQIRGGMEKVETLMTGLENDRATKFGQLAEQLRNQNETLSQLSGTTAGLREVLASQKARGQWGERMAEDVLRMAGFIENINYRKQKALLGEESGIPDFTFLLPQDLSLHMDVKFPLDNYMRYLEAGSDLDQKRHRDQFLRDVRQKVRELASRAYIDAAGGTVDCVLLFIPNESLYAFIHEQDRELLELGMKSKIVFCSPATLFAVLAVVRQAVDNFQLERTSDEILRIMGTFSAQWEKLVEKTDKLGRSLDTVRRDYDDLIGTRRRGIDRQLDRIQALRDEQAIELAEGDDDRGGAGRLVLEA